MRRVLSSVLLLTAALLSTPQAAEASEPVIQFDISRTVQAVNYKMNATTDVPMMGTELIPRAEGQARVIAGAGGTSLEVSLKGMAPPTKFGPSLTYVLWALTPEGRTSNLGELQMDDSRAKIQATTRLTAFALIVTAEPYFAVSAPSEVVVIENMPDKYVKGTVQQVTASQELFQRGLYKGLKPQTIDPSGKVPVYLYQARGAQQMARMAEAEQYASAEWAKAQKLLQEAEADLQSKKGSVRKQAGGVARQAVQAFEDARAIAVKLAAQAKAEAEKRAEAERQAAAVASAQKAAAEASAAAQAAVEAAEAQRATAEAAAARAREQAARAEKERAVSDAERSAALRAEQEARAQAQAALRSKEQLRAQLLAQFNQVLPTQDTPRGLVANLGGVNFATNSADLTAEARERLARFSGLIAPYPGLRIDVEGYTDNTGTPEGNLKLSQARAASVVNYLVQQGVKPESASAKGLGDATPVADNATREGRAQNRRVEIVVSGEVIGTKLGQQ